MGAAAAIPRPQIERDEILSHLEQILANRRFATAERNARFLRFVVESTLEGKADEIKESVIATEVYRRSSDYDPKADSIVRVEASRLRQKLRSYYENEGRDSGMRFHLPSGSYVPSFERLDPAPAGPQQAVAAPSKYRFAIGIALLLVAAALLLHFLNRPKAADSGLAEAATAWQEGVALMALDPHTAQTTSGPPTTILKALERLEFSVARNPFRAQAWASLAEAYDYTSGYVGRDLAEDGPRMEAAAHRAIALDDNLAAGHHMHGLFLKCIQWDFQRAESEYQRALRLDPRNAWAAMEYADLLWETDRLSQAADEIRKTRALLPAVPALAAKEAEIQLAIGHTDGALTIARSAVEMKRTSLRGHVVLGMALEAKGDSESALAEYAHVLEAEPSDRRALPAYGYLLARTGQPKRAREVIAQLERIHSSIRNSAVQIAVVHAGLGEDKAALDWLEKAWRTRQAHFPFAAAEPRFHRFHRNPRFVKLLHRIGLKPVA